MLVYKPYDDFIGWMCVRFDGLVEWNAHSLGVEPEFFNDEIPGVTT